MTYEEWTQRLETVAREQYGFTAFDAKDLAWKDFFDDGYSPEDALNEDQSCG